MSKKTYDEKELLALISEVESQFAEHLAKSEKTSKKEPAEEHGYDEDDVREMDSMYRSMTKSEAEIHYKSVKKALFGDEESVQKTEAQEEANDDGVLETEIESLKKSNEDLRKDLESVTALLKKAFTKSEAKVAPDQKAITEIQYLNKSEDDLKKDERDLSKLTKSEINSKLTAQIKSGKLQKNDKEAIQTYFDKGSINSIKHLL